MKLVELTFRLWPVRFQIDAESKAAIVGKYVDAGGRIAYKPLMFIEKPDGVTFEELVSYVEKMLSGIAAEEIT